MKIVVRVTHLTGMMAALDKRCTKCKQLKSPDSYSPDRRRKDGLQARCKYCSNKVNLDRYRNNPEVRLKKKLYDVEYVNKNRDRKNSNTNAWNDKNRGVIRERTSDWKKRNKHKVTSYTRKRQAAKLKRTPPWLTKDHLEEMEQFYWLAKDLRCVSGEEYHVDHIIPLQGKNMCGLHVPWNLQVLPADINCKKGNQCE